MSTIAQLAAQSRAAKKKEVEAAAAPKPKTKQQQYDDSIKENTFLGGVPGVTQLQRLALGAKDIVPAVSNRLNQIGYGALADLGLDVGKEGLAASHQRESARRAEMEGVSDPVRTTGTIAASMLPALASMGLTAPAAGASMMANWGTPAAASALSGYLTQPETADEATWQSRLGRTGMNTAAGLVGPALGKTWDTLKHMKHASERPLPIEAARRFKDQQFQNLVEMNPRPRTVPASAGLRTANQALVGQETAAAKAAMSNQASSLYDSAKMLAGNQPITLTAARNAGQAMSGDMGAIMAGTNKPILRKLLTQSNRNTTRFAPGARPGDPDIAIPADATLDEIIEITKVLRTEARKLGNSGNSGAQNYMNDLANAFDQDIDRLASTDANFRQASDAYQEGKQFFMDRVVPLVDDETTTGAIEQGGRLAEKNARGYFDTAGAGPSVSHAIEANPALVPALRRQLGDMSDEKLTTDPAGLAKLWSEGTTVQNITSPREFDFMQDVSTHIANPGKLDILLQGKNAAARKNPVLAITAADKLARMIGGIDHFGTPSYQSLSSPLARALAGSGYSTASGTLEED